MAEKKVIEIEVKTQDAVKSMDALSKSTKEAGREFDKAATFAERYGEELQPLTTRMGEAEDRLYELANAGQTTTQEYKDLLKTVGEFRKVQISTDMAVDASASTLGQKLGGALGGVTSGFSLAQGAFAAFGSESKEVEQALLKVQAAMAIQQGAQGIKESINSFKQLGAVLKANTIVQRTMTAAQYAYNLAMSLNPIGAIIAATIALIAAGYGLIKMFQASTEATAKNESAVKKNDAALKQQIKSSEKASEALKTKNGHEYEMAKASGASTKALRALALKHAEEEVALNKASLATAKNTYEKNKNTLANLINSDASDELIEKQREITIESRKASAEERKDLEEAIKNKKDIVRKNQVEVRQELTDNNNKSKESNKAHNEAIKQQNEEAAKAEKDRIKTLNENILSLNEEIRVSKLTDEEKEVDAINKKYTKLIEEGKKAKIDVSKLEEDKRLALAGITKKYDDLEKVAEDEKIAKEKEKIATEKAILEELSLSEGDLKLAKLKSKYEADQLLYKDNKEILKALDDKYAADKILTETETADKQKAIDKDVADKKKATLDSQLNLVKGSFQAFEDVATLFAGKNKKAQKTAFNIQKAANIASATIDTYTAATAAFKSAVGIPVVGPVLAPIAAAGAVAAGLINIKKIAASKFEGGETPSTGGGGGSGGGGGATVPTMSAPQFNVVGQSGVNQLASLNQQPIQAYVVSGQVTSQQALDRNRLANATLGG
jgi:F0F1-type ATP synthase membrane subunit c/vacuolar-type H+-ATPase subunit K